MKFDQYSKFLKNKFSKEMLKFKKFAEKNNRNIEEDKLIEYWDSLFEEYMNACEAKKQ